MKFIICFTLLLGLNFVGAQEVNENSQNVELSNCEETQECEVEENQILQFLINEVIPSFEELQGLQPSFNITLSPNGVAIHECSLGMVLKQARMFNFSFLEENFDDFETRMEAGQPSFISLTFLCDEYDFSNSEQNYRLVVSIQDEDFNPSFYGLKLTSFDQEQIYLKIYSAELDVTVQMLAQELMMDSEGSILPLDSSLEEATPLNIETTFKVNGMVQLSLPTAENGKRVETQFVANINGDIYLSDEGEMIPFLNISME